MNLADPQALAALLHETQHIVQRHEGFAPGASPIDPALASHPQVAEVANYIRSHFGNAFPGTVTPDEVKALRPKSDQQGQFRAG